MKLDNEQQIAVDSDAKNIVVLAAAGSGKSSTLLARISRLMNDGVPASDILALTFTNASAVEMRNRFKKLTEHELPMFCTFHSFCYQLIVKDYRIRESIGYSNIPDVADDADVRKIWTTVKQMCSTKLSDDMLNNKIPITNRKDQFEYDVFWKQYNKQLRKENLITFDIMCYEICKLFSENDPVVDQYKRQYKYIFIDEFQDTDPKQWKFAKSFTDSNIFVVGDAKQSIYGFRNADVEIIKGLTKDSEFTTIKLYHNYRSTSQICEHSNEIHDYWGDVPYNLEMVSDRAGQDVEIMDAFYTAYEYDPELHRCIDIPLSSEAVKTNIFTVLEDTKDSDSVAILCRSNSEVSEISNLFKEYNIAFNTRRSPKNSEQLLKSAIDSEYLVNWLSEGLTSKQYNEYVKLRMVDPTYATETGFYHLYYEKFKKQFDKILEIRSILASEALAQQKCEVIAKILRVKYDVMDLQDNSNESIIKFLQSEIDKAKDTNIYIGTIHSVKGLEFDTVHVIGVNGRRFPLCSDEQYNIYYVACTRAKNKLVVWFDRKD